MGNCDLLFEWGCLEPDCDKQFKYRTSLREHTKKIHKKILCRCGICRNTDITIHSNFCNQCHNGKCSQCGRDTRSRI